MREEEIRAALAKILARLAPEADLASIDPGEPLQRALDIDSFDFLTLLTAIRDELGVTVAESEYGQVGTLQKLERFLLSRLPDRPTTQSSLATERSES